MGDFFTPEHMAAMITAAKSGIDLMAAGKSGVIINILLGLPISIIAVFLIFDFSAQKRRYFVAKK